MIRDFMMEQHSFDTMLKKHSLDLKRKIPEILQVNMGKKCNQRCRHCHIDAGPEKTEMMEKDTILKILELLKESNSIHTVDITGGAPELNPHFRSFVQSLSKETKQVIVRSNLTVYFEDGLEDIPAFLAKQKVQINASLPCYLQENVDYQRGQNTFVKCIETIKHLNELGYGKKESGLILNLIHNPVSASLPPEQRALETSYRKVLREKYGLEFNHLYVMTNVPIKRFEHLLHQDGIYNRYLNMLKSSFNPHAAAHIMCRNLLSIGWDGYIYDCDFNQALGLPLKETPHKIGDLSKFDEIICDISFSNHCFACTAGAGSSCNGAMV